MTSLASATPGPGDVRTWVSAEVDGIVRRTFEERIDLSPGSYEDYVGGALVVVQSGEAQKIQLCLPAIGSILVEAAYWEKQLCSFGLAYIRHVSDLLALGQSDVFHWLSARKSSAGFLIDLQVVQHRIAAVQCIREIVNEFLSSAEGDIDAFASFVRFYLQWYSCATDLCSALDVCMKLSGGQGYLQTSWIAKANADVRAFRSNMPLITEYATLLNPSLRLIL